MGLGGGILGGIIGGIIGGPVGAGIGAGVGLLLTGKKRQPNTQNHANDTAENAIFMLSCWFRCYGKLAKADGLVSREEADFIQSMLKDFNSDHELKSYLIKSFNEGKCDKRSFAELVRQLTRYATPDQYRNIMHGFCLLVLADGCISGKEKENLIEAENILGLPGYTDEIIWQSSCHQNAEEQPKQPSLEESYQVLGVSPEASDAEIRTAWRKQIMEFHPDKIQGKGLSEAFIRFAEDQTRRINEAYEKIAASRGIK